MRVLALLGLLAAFASNGNLERVALHDLCVKPAQGCRARLSASPNGDPERVALRESSNGDLERVALRESSNGDLEPPPPRLRRSAETSREAGRVALHEPSNGDPERVALQGTVAL